MPLSGVKFVLEIVNIRWFRMILINILEVNWEKDSFDQIDIGPFSN